MGRRKREPWDVHWDKYDTGYLSAEFYTDESKRIRMKTGTTDFVKAQELVLQRIKSIRAGMVSNSKNISLSEALDRMKQEVWQYQKDWKKRYRESDRILEQLGQKILLKDLHEQSINKWVTLLRESGNSGSTVNRKTAILKATMNRAHKHWRLLERVPVFPSYREKKGGHKRECTEDELKVILQNSDELHSLLFKLMYQTGMRKSEVLRITEDQLNTDDLSIVLYDTKSGEDGVIPVPSELFGELKDWIDNHGSIDTTVDSMRPQWNHGRKVLGLMEDHKFTPGCLRHSFALRLVRLGYSAPVVQALLRHSTILTTQSYFKQAQTDLFRVRDELEKL